MNKNYQDGQRNTAERFECYGLAELICPQDKVLDLGCATGAFAKAIHEVQPDVVYCGIDIKPELIEIAKKTPRLGPRIFVCGDAAEIAGAESWAGILSLALHKRVGTPIDEYARRLEGSVAASGFILLESHDLGTWDKDWPDVVKAFTDLGLMVEKTGDSPPEVGPSGNDIRREWVVLRKAP